MAFANQPANPLDGTQLGTGEIISNEAIDPNVGARRDPAQPGTTYKVPRSKIAVGPYDQDYGDASVENPLRVESTLERQLAERAFLQASDHAQRDAALRYSAEALYGNSHDCRGHFFATRGTR